MLCSLLTALRKTRAPSAQQTWAALSRYLKKKNRQKLTSTTQPATKRGPPEINANLNSRKRVVEEYAMLFT